MILNNVRRKVRFSHPCMYWMRQDSKRQLRLVLCKSSPLFRQGHINFLHFARQSFWQCFCPQASFIVWYFVSGKNLFWSNLLYNRLPLKNSKWLHLRMRKRFRPSLWGVLLCLQALGSRFVRRALMVSKSIPAFGMGQRSLVEGMATMTREPERDSWSADAVAKSRLDLLTRFG